MKDKLGYDLYKVDENNDVFVMITEMLKKNNMVLLGSGLVGFCEDKFINEMEYALTPNYFNFYFLNKTEKVMDFFTPSDKNASGEIIGLLEHYNSSTGHAINAIRVDNELGFEKSVKLLIGSIMSGVNMVLDGNTDFNKNEVDPLFLVAHYYHDKWADETLKENGVDIE